MRHIDINKVFVGYRRLARPVAVRSWVSGAVPCVHEVDSSPVVSPTVEFSLHKLTDLNLVLHDFSVVNPSKVSGRAWFGHVDQLLLHRNHLFVSLFLEVLPLN